METCPKNSYLTRQLIKRNDFFRNYYDKKNSLEVRLIDKKKQDQILIKLISDSGVNFYVTQTVLLHQKCQVLVDFLLLKNPAMKKKKKKLTLYTKDIYYWKNTLNVNKKINFNKTIKQLAPNLEQDIYYYFYTDYLDH